MNKLILPLAALAFATSATAQDAPEPGAPGSLAWHNTQQAALHSLSHEDGWHTLEGGVKFRRTAGDGTGPAPTVQDVVQVNYTGTFADGETFDSNAGRAPIEFPLSNLVRGWQVAIPYMGVGDTAEIAIPAELAYGLQGRGPIPGGATLFFTIELVGIPSKGV
ncbi:FKBP-type peptidyl-prolyl cis-trans isomerase [Aurantiacibacter poecillastricola]|uniref:FKBP-type peptidyl-prolyl cis-trans isomerase n=1 Tax=Aurantiacibacter poecillastricola TaxID=3064385 RepID=UPI00273E403D|nr:FKBP-type peptidyl-prolyl cis-trans isomerase [Aurantiacibacter sp. 219JJ12-13]MDP5262513.1 FKBP-type peptidyl-prolyl cis-trans isomerase [Aurantiacibacter sp. 219JJ12-13]